MEIIDDSRVMPLPAPRRRKKYPGRKTEGGVAPVFPRDLAIPAQRGRLTSPAGQVGESVVD
jgi:hypothetical protein